MSEIDVILLIFGSKHFKMNKIKVSPFFVVVGLTIEKPIEFNILINIYSQSFAASAFN